MLVPSLKITTGHASVDEELPQGHLTFSLAALSSYNDDIGPLAQWLEQGTHNPLVVGSNPTGPTNSTAYGILGRLPGRVLTPVIDHVGIGSIEPVRMRTLHGDTLRDHPESVGAHPAVGIFASQVDASLYRRSA